MSIVGIALRAGRQEESQVHFSYSPCLCSPKCTLHEFPVGVSFLGAYRLAPLIVGRLRGMS